MSLEVTIKNMKVLPKLFDSETWKKNDSISLTISPLQSIADSSIAPKPSDSSIAKPSTSIVGGTKKSSKSKRTARPRLMNKFNDYGYEDEFFGGEDSFATIQLKKDVMNLKNKRTANELVLDRIFTSSESKGNDETTININSDSDKKIGVDSNQESTATEALVNKLEKVAVDSPVSVTTPVAVESPISGTTPKKETTETTESNTVQKFNDQVKQITQRGGVIGVPDFFDDEDVEDKEEEEYNQSGGVIGVPDFFDDEEVIEEDEEDEYNQSGGDFNTFISSLYNKKVGGKKRQYSEKATEFNRKTTEIIKSVYPNINPEELRAVRSEIYQTIRAKYDPEVFKTLKDYEKSELLLKATTPAVVKKIDLKKAVENKRKRIEEYFGKKKEETPSNPEDDVKETKKAKKEKKEKKAKRGGGIEEETLELPFALDGGCNCMRGGCGFY